MRQLAAFCVLLLAISEPPLAHAKKVVLLFPHQVRRSPLPPWQSGYVRYKKSSQQGNDYHHNSHAYRSDPGQYRRRPYHKFSSYPHGGDDFDQGHESVNHVHVPYGKDIGHSITMGKGYIPYDSIKGSFSLGNQRYTGQQGHRYLGPEYGSTSFSSPGTEYPVPASHIYEQPQMDSYFSGPEDGADPHERRNDQKKFYSSRSIEKDLGLSNHFDLNSLVAKTKEQLPQNTDSLVHQDPVQGSVLLPSGVPPATIAGSKEGIVFRDTVALDEYHRKVQEMTKSWPSLLTQPYDPNQQMGHGYRQSIQAASTFPTVGIGGSGFAGLGSNPGYGYGSGLVGVSGGNVPSGSLGLGQGTGGWFADFGLTQPKQSYAVKEDQPEPGHDFRTMPIQTSPFQVPLSMNVELSQQLGQSVHG